MNPSHIRETIAWLKSLQQGPGKQSTITGNKLTAELQHGINYLQGFL